MFTKTIYHIKFVKALDQGLKQGVAQKNNPIFVLF